MTADFKCLSCGHVSEGVIYFYEDKQNPNIKYDKDWEQITCEKCLGLFLERRWSGKVVHRYKAKGFHVTDYKKVGGK